MAIIFAEASQPDQYVLHQNNDPQQFIRDNNTNGFKYFKEIMYDMTFLES